MRKFVTALLLIACGSQVAPGAPAKGAARTCRILFVAPAADAPEKVFLFDDKSSQEAELPSANLSPIYKLSSGATTLSLFSQKPADLKNLPPDAPSAAVPEKVKDCYLLINSDPTNKVTPLRMEVIDTSNSAFSAGQMMWINISNFEVSGQLGKTTFKVNPNSRVIVNSPVAGYDSFPVEIGFSSGKGESAPP